MRIKGWHGSCELLMCCSLIAAATSPLSAGPTGFPPHNIATNSACSSPKCVGTRLNCTFTIIYADEFGDTNLIVACKEIVKPGPGQITIPAVGNLYVVGVSGNTTATVGGSLPVFLGPPFSHNNGLPGLSAPGRVTFSATPTVINAGHPDLSYVIQSSDPNTILTRLFAIWSDFCDENVDDCSTANTPLEPPAVPTSILQAPVCTVAPVSGVICTVGPSTTLTANATGGAGPYSYSWTGPGGYTATSAAISPTTPGTYCCAVTESHGCTSIAPGCASMITGGCTVPPVVISTLSHEHIFNPSFPPNGLTTTRDMVPFPCTGGACNGPGFSAAFGQGDTIELRFQAPAGKRFVVTKAPGGTQYVFVEAAWQTSNSDSASNFTAGTVTFENLTGPPPTLQFGQSDVSNNGEWVYTNQQYDVSANCSFTTMRVQFTVNQNLAHLVRTYHEVFSTGFGSARVVIGAASDAVLMRIVPICAGDINGSNAVNVDDLLAVINGWGACPPPCPPHCVADLDHNCFVNVDDLLAVISAWGACP